MPLGSGRSGGPDSDGHGAGRAVRAQGAHRWGPAGSPCHAAWRCVFSHPETRPAPVERAQEGGWSVGRQHVATRCETKCASAPQRAGGCWEAGLGEEGALGHQPSIPTRPCWQRARLATLPFALLTLGAAPPSLPASQGGWGGQRPAARTPELRTSCHVDPPVSLGVPALAECSHRRPCAHPLHPFPKECQGKKNSFPPGSSFQPRLTGGSGRMSWMAQAAMLDLVPGGTASLKLAPRRTQSTNPASGSWQQRRLHLGAIAACLPVITQPSLASTSSPRPSPW